MGVHAGGGRKRAGYLFPGKSEMLFYVKVIWEISSALKSNSLWGYSCEKKGVSHPSLRIAEISISAGRKCWSRFLCP